MGFKKFKQNKLLSLISFCTLVFILIFHILSGLLYGAFGWDNKKMIIKGKVSSPFLLSKEERLFLVYIKNSQVFLVTSSNKGEDWTSPVKIGNFTKPENPILTLVDNQLFLFYTDLFQNKREIFFSRSLDESFNKFSQSQNVTATGRDSVFLSLSPVNQNIFLVWSEKFDKTYQLFTLFFNTKDLKAEKPRQITSGSESCLNASVQFWFDTLYLVWRQADEEKSKIMYSQFDLEEERWKTPSWISKGVNKVFSPFLTIAEETLNVVYPGLGAYFDIYLNRQNLQEESWNIPQGLTDSLMLEHSPILLDTLKGNYLFWIEQDESRDIFYSKSDDLIFDQKYNISESGMDAVDFKVVNNIEDNRLYLCWIEEKRGLFFAAEDMFCPVPQMITPVFSSSGDLTLKWKINEDPSGIKQFAYLMDQKENTVPGVFLSDYPENKTVFYDVEGGGWYFHIRAKDGKNNLSETFHHRITVKREVLDEKKKEKSDEITDQVQDKKEMLVYNKLKDQNRINKEKPEERVMILEDNQKMEKEHHIMPDGSAGSMPIQEFKAVKALAGKKVTIYLIKKGDTLWSISGKFYKKSWYCYKLAEYNKIPNPDLIYYDKKLTVPPLHDIKKERR